MHTFVINRVDDTTLYIAWKIMHLSLETNHPRFHDFLYDLPDTIKADDFAEQNNMTRRQIYLEHIRKIFELGLIKNLRIRVIKNVNQWLGIYEVDIPVELAILPTDILIQNRGSEHARFISWEFSQHEIINISWIHKVDDEYRTCFLFEPDYDSIAEYIYQYLLLWGKQELQSTINYIRPEKQIESFHAILLDKSNLYGDIFEYTVWEHKNLSEITLILYFSYILRDIEMQGLSDNVIRTNNIIRIDPLTFNIKSKLKIGNEVTTKLTKAKIYFDENSWIFYDNWDQVGLITLDTQQFYFFKCLYDRFPAAVEHKEIAQYIKQHSLSVDAKLSSKAEVGRFLSNIKRKINENILAYISSPTERYQLMNLPKI